MNLLTEGGNALGIVLDEKKEAQFKAYMSLLLEWNEKINLTAITEEKEIIIKHYLDSLSLASTVSLRGKTLIDVGTGAGLPGIPLKIYEEDLTVTLLDSLEKRIRFLKEVIGQLSLKGIEAVHGRAEDYGVKQDHREKYDYAVAGLLRILLYFASIAFPL